MTDIELEPIAEKFWRVFMRLNRIVDRQMTANGASLARTKLLLFLDRDGPKRSAEIAEYFEHSPRTVTEAIDALEREGMVRRDPDPADRRAKLVSVTEAGRAALHTTEPLRRRLVGEIFGSMPDSLLQQFDLALDTLAAGADRNEDWR